MATVEQQMAQTLGGFRAVRDARLVASRDALEALGQASAADMVSRASWQDITGDARAGLQWLAAHPAALTAGGFILLVSLVFYGKYLEFNHGSQFSVVQPAVADAAAQLSEILGDIWT